MAHDDFGNSKKYIQLNFTTKHLSNAVELRIDTSSLETDTVHLVHALSEILNIDIMRIRDVDSYQIQNKSFTQKLVNQNQLLYRNRIVISPSQYDDRIRTY